MMKKFTYTFLLLVFMGLCSLQLQAQSESAYIKAAEKASLTNDHYSALVYYKNVLEFDDENPAYINNVATTARKLNALTTSETYYKKLMLIDQDAGNYPEAAYYLAGVQHKLGKYDTAQINYEIFLAEYDGADQEMINQATRLSKEAEWAKTFIQTPWTEFEMGHLSGNINTPYTEFGAVKVSDSIYYSSLRFENKADSYSPKRPLSGILISKGEATGNKAGEGFNIEGKHTAHTAFNADMTRMYFTLCSYQKADSIHCNIYYRDKIKSVWGEMKNVEAINGLDYTTTQPNVAFDSDLNQSYLYYVSDKSGGEGNLDIYRIEISDNGFGTPRNIKEINTPQDEVTPFYHKKTNTLYFSSNGHKSLGGLDVFKSYMTRGQAGEVQILGTPLNSSYNDLYYYLNEEGNEAFMSSNRVGSFYMDEEVQACCYDIYRVDIKPFANLIAQTFDASTQDSLYGTTIQLFDMNENPILLDESTNANLASATFPLMRDTEYMLIGNKDGYLPDTVLFNTSNIDNLDDIVKKMYLNTDELILNAFTFDANTKQQLIGATVTIVDMDDPNAEPLTITNYDGNDFTSKLERGKRYRVIANRKGYKPATVVVNTNDYQNKSVINENLYLEIGDLDDFLPLVLFFDNDYPNPKTRLTTTAFTYNQTYPPYFDKKQNFISKYSSPLKVGPRGEAAIKVDRFFENEVRKGHEDLSTFLEVLEAHLAQGDQVSIFLKGYTSPRASKSYNIALGKRRIVSVENQLKINQALNAYLSSGKLTVKQQSFGETTSPKNVVASYKDERNSIYSVEASKERRVEIVQIQIEK